MTVSENCQLSVYANCQAFDYNLWHATTIIIIIVYKNVVYCTVLAIAMFAILHVVKHTQP